MFEIIYRIGNSKKEYKAHLNVENSLDAAKILQNALKKRITIVKWEDGSRQTRDLGISADREGHEV